MIQKETENKSFINMWRYLQDKDIENNMFMLELKDESLKDFKLSDLEINDKDKRSHLMKKVFEECRNNIWFFFREVVRIQNPISYYSNQKCNYSRYILSPIEMLMIFAYDKGINFLTYRDNKPSGIRTTQILLELYSYIFNDKKFSVLCYGDSQKLLEKVNMIISSNGLIIPEFDPINEYVKVLKESKNTCEGENSILFNPIEYSKKDVFFHISKNTNIKNLYDILFKLKFSKNKHPQIYGIVDYDYDLIKKDIQASVYPFMNIIDHFMFSKNDTYKENFEVDFFDNYGNKIKENKIYIIKRYI